MKKILLNIIFLSFVQLGYTQVDLKYLKNTWMSIDCIKYDSIHQEKCKGRLFLKFDKDSLQRFYAYGNPIPYQITESNEIKSDYFEDATIVLLTSDSLKIVFYGNTLLTFIPVIKNKRAYNHETLKDLLVQNQWLINTHDEIELQIEFLDYMEDSTNYRSDLYKEIFSVEKLYTTNIGKEEYVWTLLTLNETTILFINSFNLFNGYSFDILIKNVSNDRISGIAWIKGEPFKINLIRQKRIKESDLALKETILTKGIWELDDFEFIMPQFRFRYDHFSDDEIYTELILDSLDFVQKKVKYDFKSDHTFEFMINDNVAVLGTWEFSKTGKTLKLKRQDLFEENLPIVKKYIDLDKLSDSELQFINSEKINVGVESDNIYLFTNYPIKQKYKNRQ